MSTISDNKMKNILKQFVAKDDSTLEDVDPMQLGSVEIKSYFDSSSVLLKLFKTTTGKASNNKPYTLSRRVSMTQAQAVMEALERMRKAADDFFEDGIDEQMMKD